MGNGAAKINFFEQDVSFFIAAVTQGRNCVQVTARKGPINKATLISSSKAYREVYGLPVADSNIYQEVQRALDRGAVLYVNRVSHYTDPEDPTTLEAIAASISLLNSASVATLTLTAVNEGTWGNTLLVTVEENAADENRFDLTIEFPEQPEMNEEFTALTMDEDDERYAVIFINENSKLVSATDEDSGDPFVGDTVTVDDTTFTAGTDFPINTQDINQMAAALAQAIENQENAVDTAVANNVITVTAAAAGAAGNAIALATTSTGDNITVSGANLAGGADAVAATGTVTYGAPSNGDTITVNGTVFTKAGALGAAAFSTIAELTGLITALAAVNAADDGAVITITAAVAGAAGNAITLAKTGGALTLSGATLGAGAGVDGADAIAATGTITFDPTPTIIDNPVAIGPIAMAGGDDGGAVDDDDWIGSSAAANGLYAFDEISDAFGLGSPEASSAAVTTAGIAYCENRADMVYICEPPSTVLNDDDALDFRNGTGIFVHSAFNSSYGAMYFGRPLVRSSKTNSIIDISTIGDVFGVHAYSDKKSEVWYAPAGIQRGKIPNALGVHYNVGSPGREAELDSLSDNQINSIIDDPDDGVVIWDELTLQRTPSATQSLHVRRLLIYMRKALKKISRVFLFEPNDPTTWRMVFNMLDPWMKDLLARRAFYEYLIQCDQDARSISDAILNTPERIDRGEFICRIFIKPTRTLKYFSIEAVITKSSANFKELLDLKSAG